MRVLLLGALLVLPSLAGGDEPEEEGIRLLVQEFRAGSPQQRTAAAYRLGRLGRRVWHLLAPCLTDPDPDVRQRARALWERCLESDDTWWCVPAPGTAFDEETHLPLRVLERRTRAEMILVRPGRFRMGSDAVHAWEGPAHDVVIERAYYLGVCEVTQAQFRRGLPEAYYFASETRGGYPASGLSWNGIREFLKRTGLRVPTEAEWEYVAQAGYDPARVDDDAWHRDNAGGETHAVGEKRANSLGFHDMLGNVAEWCADEFAAYDGDAKRVAGKTGRVVRGGSVTQDPRECRPAARRAFPADYRSDAIGFRVAHDP